MSAELQSRLEIDALMSLYCHLVDHDQGEAWANLFVPEGVFEVKGVLKLEGRDSLGAMPGVVKQQGQGQWRHQVTNVVIDKLDGADARVRAYGIVTDWSKGGAPASFSDYEILLRNDAGWRIVHLTAVVMAASGPGDG